MTYSFLFVFCAIYFVPYHTGLTFTYALASVLRYVRSIESSIQCVSNQSERLLRTVDMQDMYDSNIRCNNCLFIV